MTRLFFALVAAVLVASTALADDIRTERVQFHKGTNSATVHGVCADQFPRLFAADL